MYLHDRQILSTHLTRYMAKIELFEDQTRRGTYSQIRLDDGKKILISLTQRELAISQFVFGFPIKNIMDMINLYQLMDILYPYGPKSKNFEQSLLSIITEIALESGKNIKDFSSEFWKNVEKYSQKIKAEGERF